ncbi:solute carrier family 22 member 5-like isoform X1 [Gouania willdenowi]|uniref:Solute carrier family 22 member 5-like n=1 Tax=Gouania willdenowi TaxID=441366 RepID=A0A8C5GGC0_GOUWI|nr:solute carrier family 22 member 5-like isoform X1 [Gouania willdenowi]
MTDYESSTAFLGEWGRFQQTVFFLLCLTSVSNGFAIIAVIFLTATPQHHCLVPADLNLTAAWTNHSIPLEEDDTRGGVLVPSQCFRYKLEDIRSFSERGLLPGVDVNLSSVATEGCLDGWVYDQSVSHSTITTEWNLVCDESWKTPLTSSIFFLGVFTGSFFSGQLSDRYGRKIVLFACLGIQAVFTLIQLFSSSWTMFCIIHFVVGIGQVSNFVAAFVLGTEILSPRVRTVFSTLGMSVFFGFGYMMLPVAAYFIRDWRMLLVGLALPCLLLMPLWWFIPESPRWLLSQGRVEEAVAIVKAAAKMNNIEPPQVIFSPLLKELQVQKKTPHNFCDLLRTRNIRWISITLWLVWNTVAIAYFALSLNAINLHGNAYLNCFLSGLVEIPAYVLSWVMFHWWSRRLSLFSTFIVGGLFLLIVQILPTNLVSLAITLEMTGKSSLSIAYGIVYAYSAEVYPTVLRNTAIGACSMAARLGSVTAPFFIYLRSYSVKLPYILMGSLTIGSGLLSLLLPETFGMPLPDTITHMQPFPGCCVKTPYTLTDTEEKSTAPEETNLKPK